METQDSLKVLLESRTYSIFNFRSLTFQALKRSVCDLLEDPSSSFELKAPYLSGWVDIIDDSTYFTFIINAVSPLIYVFYPGAPSILRVQSYNLAIFGKHKKWDERMHMIAQQIKEVNPDIIGVQEAKRDPLYGLYGVERVLTKFIENVAGSNYSAQGRDMMKDILELIPEYPYSYLHDSMHYSDGSTEGIGIISRFPISNIKHIQLSKSDSDGNSRSCLRATISHPMKNLLVYNTHLTYDLKGQVKQASEILRFIDSEDDKFTAQLLIGDMNSEEKYPQPMRLLEGISQEPLSRGKLDDAWKSANGEEDGFTYPSWEPSERLDRIMFRNIEAPPVCEVTGYAETEDKWPSDHCTVFADFILTQ
ncbi:unnamed protein product [Blepharisma stoltei]|uniref:Endonuclease/exonuclease/phosphatase domain-containing protein n=1 Tax=Blepharisma stoltei TaxID=1481888 RepID=A0AAU9I972_9CILI|nr:unnamed protein product [Blepharisma stoltei]